MDPTVKAICYLVAIVLAVVASLAERTPVRLFPLAFAVFVLPFCWDSFEAA